jgi:HNH endonuclease/Helix-turn-helix domain of resolvase
MTSIPESKFWAKCDRKGENDCWQWQGSKNGKGYGRFQYECKKISAHRFSYEMHYGFLPSDKVILHRCDNPSCVNPRHLSAGTVADNNRDAFAKGRNRVVGAYTKPGEQNHKAILTEAQAREIKRLYAAGYSYGQLAKRFNVSRGCVWGIASGNTWKHLDTIADVPKTQ